MRNGLLALTFLTRKRCHKGFFFPSMKRLSEGMSNQIVRGKDSKITRTSPQHIEPNKQNGTGQDWKFVGLLDVVIPQNCIMGITHGMLQIVGLQLASWIQPNGRYQEELTCRDYLKDSLATHGTLKKCRARLDFFKGPLAEMDFLKCDCYDVAAT